MKIIYWLSLADAFLFAGSLALPDTTAGSPRSIAVAVAGLIAVVIAALAHAQGTTPVTQ